MLHCSQEVRYWTEYILMKDLRLFQNVTGWDPRPNSDHCLVIGCLRGATLMEDQCYLGLHTRLPLRSPMQP